jgi:hypothetical protein
LPLRKPLETAAVELDYLYEPTPAMATPSADARDRELFAAVKEMKDRGASFHVRRQYTETLKAMNMMRVANSRRRIGTSHRRPKSRSI